MISAMRRRILTAVLALIASASVFVVSVGPAAAVPIGWMYAGQKAEVGVGIGYSPLRNAPCDGCTIMVWMPPSTGFNPGDGYVTSVVNQPWSGAPWCEVNWKGIVGWTGCWRLAPLV